MDKEHIDAIISHAQRAALFFLQGLAELENEGKYEAQWGSRTLRNASAALADAQASIPGLTLEVPRKPGIYRYLSIIEKSSRTGCPDLRLIWRVDGVFVVNANTGSINTLVPLFEKLLGDYDFPFMADEKSGSTIWSNKRYKNDHPESTK